MTRVVTKLFHLTVLTQVDTRTQTYAMNAHDLSKNPPMSLKGLLMYPSSITLDKTNVVPANQNS